MDEISGDHNEAATFVWTTRLNKLFAGAVAHLGVKYVIPETLLALMGVDAGLTLQDVASHWEKYKLYLERMEGLSGLGGDPDTDSRTLKRPRLVWTPQLHKRFEDAVAHLGIKNAIPKTIMQLMSVDGLTTENVASHLQNYRLLFEKNAGFVGFEW
ncbi:transcription factor PCL1 [Artemisia annua]|uniref:Transcription factor PCL1 n=1 Tax=Artemisia annua TaxID=35608 RepID=A0A2U1N6S4_ARTAN|nr:transcription factor PCL1 [Artemisia annua]